MAAPLRQRDQDNHSSKAMYEHLLGLFNRSQTLRGNEWERAQRDLNLLAHAAISDDFRDARSQFLSDLQGCTAEVTID